MWQLFQSAFWHKTQQIQNSCFPTCLDMVFRNILGDDWTQNMDAENYFSSKIDMRQVAPNIDQILEWFPKIIGDLNIPVRSTRNIFINQHGMTGALAQTNIENFIVNHKRVGIIGAINDCAGHATMIYIDQGVAAFFADPQIFPPELINKLNIEILNGDENEAICFAPNAPAMEMIFLIGL